MWQILQRQDQVRQIVVIQVKRPKGVHALENNVQSLLSLIERIVEDRVSEKLPQNNRFKVRT